MTTTTTTTRTGRTPLGQKVHQQMLGSGRDHPQLKFKRVMAGEYTAEAPNRWFYEVWQGGEGCSACSHSHDGWFAVVRPAYRVREEIGEFRTMTEAKIAATIHAAEAGIIEVQGE